MATWQPFEHGPIENLQEIMVNEYWSTLQLAKDAFSLGESQAKVSDEVKFVSESILKLLQNLRNFIKYKSIQSN